jgi:hypothetical protein
MEVKTQYWPLFSDIGDHFECTINQISKRIQASGHVHAASAIGHRQLIQNFEIKMNRHEFALTVTLP